MKLTYPLLALTLLLSPLSAETPEVEITATETSTSTADLIKISEAFGHLIGKNLESFNVDLDSEALVRGLKNALAGVPAPMNENDCIQAISQIQESAFQKVATDNLSEATAFMEKNSQEEGVVLVEKGKLHYKELVKGNGSPVPEHATPLIRYKGTFVDGNIFGASSEDEVVCLDETIPGFAKGILGMTEGSKRILYVHPDMGYGTTGFLPPNSLLVFEIDLVKSNVTVEDKESLANAMEPKNIIG